MIEGISEARSSPTASVRFVTSSALMTADTWSLAVDAECVCDLGIGQPVSEQFQHLELAWGEQVFRLRSRAGHNRVVRGLRSAKE